MTTPLGLIRASDINPPKKGRGKHHTSDNSSAVAIKRRIQNEIARADKKKTIFGDHVGGYGPNGVKNAATGKTNAPNKGDQGTYIRFKSIFTFPLTTKKNGSN